MLVKELIEKLKEMDKEKNVIVQEWEESDIHYGGYINKGIDLVEEEKQECVITISTP